MGEEQIVILPGDGARLEVDRRMYSVGDSMGAWLVANPASPSRQATRTRLVVGVSATVRTVRRTGGLVRLRHRSQHRHRDQQRLGDLGH